MGLNKYLVLLIEWLLDYPELLNYAQQVVKHNKIPKNHKYGL